MKLPNVVILAGGESSRFFPFANKNLTSFLGNPLLYWHFDQLVRMGFRAVTVVANEKTLPFLKRVLAPKHLTVSYLIQKGNGQAAAVMSVSDMASEESMLIINGSDVYDDSLLLSLLKKYQEDPSQMYLGAQTVDTYFPGGYIKLNSDGNIEGIIEKPGEGNEPSTLVTVVADIIPKTILYFPILKKFVKYSGDGYEKSLVAYISKGTTSRPVETKIPWNPIKYPWHILTVMDMSLDSIKQSSIAGSVKIAKHVTIEGPVIIEDNVRICEYTKIVGPAYIGKGTIIGNNNIIRRSHIGESVVTGFNTDITRSYVGSNSWFHSNYIGDSVIGDNVSLGSGTVLANLRLDESSITSLVKGEKIDTKRNKLGAMIGDNVRIGVNASIMPGIKIGKNSFIGAGVVLSEDIDEESYVRISPSVVITKNQKKIANSRDQFRTKL